jgi:hypothetical protein
MALALRAVAASIAQVFAHGSISVLSNVVTFLFSIPLLVAIGVLAYPSRSWSLIPLGAAFLVGVLPNPAALPAHAVARVLAHDEDVDFRRQLGEQQALVQPAFRCWLASIAVTAIIILNLAYYSHSGLPIAGSLELLWLFILLIWIAVNLYVLPLVLDQEDKRVLPVYRNAAVMVLARPAFSLVILPVWLAVLILTCTTGLATVIGFSLGASIQQNAFTRLVPTFNRTLSS